MKVTKKFGLTLGALAVACLLVVQPVRATTAITFLDSAGNPATINPALPTHTSSDYSNSGLDLGNDGFLFFNFGQTSPTQGTFPNADVTSQNAANQLPAWIGVDFDPTSATYSFGKDPGLEAFAKGGQPGWANLTLPDGASGASGALVDPQSDNNSSNTITGLSILAGAPSSFLMHIVTDNTNGEHDAVDRFRAREDLSGLDSKLRSLTFDGNPDVYTFRYDGVVAGDIIKLQLNSGVLGEDASIAGIMFDTVVPEPTSAMLLVLGGIGLIGRRRRR